MRTKGILVILIIVTVTGIAIVFSANQAPTPGLQDSPVASDDVTIDINAGKIDTVEASDEVIIEKQISNIENGVEHYLDENGTKHYTIAIEDVAETKE